MKRTNNYAVFKKLCGFAHAGEKIVSRQGAKPQSK
jgi:hypothetical protein